MVRLVKMHFRGKLLLLTFTLVLFFTLYIISNLQNNNEYYQRVIERLLDKYVTSKNNSQSNSRQKEVEDTIVLIKESEKSATPHGFVDNLRDKLTKTKKLEGKHQPEDGYEPHNLWNRALLFGDNTEMATFLSEQKRRKMYLAKVCSEISVRKRKLVSYRNLIFDKPDHLTFCPVFKSASTSWSMNLIQLRGLTKKGEQVPNSQDVLRKILPKLTMGSSLSLLKETISFMIVRHPFERVVSCYRDKFENGSNPYYYKVYGEKMVRKYRQLPKDFNKEERLKRLLAVGNIVQEGARRKESRRGNPFTKPAGPTFKEFVQFITDSTHDDEHWRPYFDHCSPCSITYDFIIKFENLQDESKNFIEFLNRTGQLETRWHNRAKSGVLAREVSCNYFKELTVDLVEKLLYKYDKDLRLYEYERDAYVKCASDHVEGTKLSVTSSPPI